MSFMIHYLVFARPLCTELTCFLYSSALCLFIVVMARAPWEGTVRKSTARRGLAVWVSDMVTDVPV